MINWKVRINNKMFWLAIVPALLLLAQQVAGLFGFMFDFTDMQEKLIAIIGTVFSILSILGIVADPTTEGVGDSKQALTYEVPKGK